MSIAVINLKSLFKNFLKIIVVFVVILLVILSLRKINLFSINIFNKFSLIDNNILLFSYLKNDISKQEESGMKKVLVSELSVFNIQELMESENQEEVTEFNDEINNEESKSEEVDINENEIIGNNNIEENNISSVLPTKVISSKNKKDTYTDVYKNVRIKNESKYKLTEEMVTPNVDFKNKKDIIIYHTHTCESYTPTENNNYIASGNFRTTDLNYSVARVGSELTNNLILYGYNVIHDTTYHDYPAYTGSYTRGLSTITSIINNSSNSEFIIDLHRDALGSNSSYGPTVQIGDEIVAQIMFVIGTDGGGLEHPNWNNNLKLAIKIQEKANEMYPGLFKPIILRNSRYNQHVTSGACIIEVGATGNTLEECNNSMKYLAKVISEVMK